MNFETVKQNLLARGYAVSCFDTAKQAADYLNAAIDQKTVGMGGSVTLGQMNLYDLLSAHNEVYNHARLS